MSIKINSIKSKAKEYIKFNIVGISNFLISQCFYITLNIVFKINYILAYTVTSVLSVIASYIFNTKYTFREENFSTKKFSLTVLIYILQYIINMGSIIAMVNIFNIGEILASFFAPAISTPIVFILMRLAIKNKRA